jgi:hypothetical protein
MDFVYIQYRLRTADGREILFRLRFDPKTFELVEATPDNLPPWTGLEFHKCPHCPLTLDDAVNCPAAVRIAPALKSCESLDAYVPVQVEITLPERTIIANKPLQKALASVLGLIMATSGCPHTAALKPIARYHLPFATEDETLQRVTSMYLLGQYIAHKDGDKPDIELEGLVELYRKLQVVNESMVARLKAGGIKPAMTQAIVPLDLLSHSLPLNIRISLERIRPYFDPLIPN